MDLRVGTRRYEISLKTVCIEASKEDDLMALRLGLEMEEEMLQMKKQENFNIIFIYL
jgi:hypothetical protein